MIQSALSKLKGLVRPYIRPNLHKAVRLLPHTVYGTDYGGILDLFG